MMRSISLLCAASLLSLGAAGCNRTPTTNEADVKAEADLKAFENQKGAPVEQRAEAPKPHRAAPREREVAIAAPVICNDCGTVTNVETVTQKGEAHGMGAIAGAVIGGVVGHQMGKGRGNDVATAAGAAGGAYAGHQAEKYHNRSTYYRVTVSMEAGGSRVVESDAPVGVGSKVRVIGNSIQPI